MSFGVVDLIETNHHSRLSLVLFFCSSLGFSDSVVGIRLPNRCRLLFPLGLRGGPASSQGGASGRRANPRRGASGAVRSSKVETPNLLAEAVSFFDASLPDTPLPFCGIVVHPLEVRSRRQSPC